MFRKHIPKIGFNMIYSPKYAVLVQIKSSHHDMMK